MPIVIKYGGHAMISDSVRREVAAQIRLLAQQGQEPVVVHGGGPLIEAELKRAGVASSFVRGLRVTSADSLPIIEQVLSRLSKVLAQEIGPALGLSGRDARLLVAEPMPELGLVGTVRQVNTELIHTLLAARLTPVIACIAGNAAGDDALNVNADNVAGAVAGALAAPVVFLTDVSGVLDDPALPESLLAVLTESDARTRIADGRIKGGMVPKVEAAMAALAQGASFAVIADGRYPELLAQAVTGSAGTRMVRS